MYKFKIYSKMEKRMAMHSNILAWKIPWTEEPGRPQSMVSQRVRHDWAINTHTAWWFDLHILWNNWASLVAQLEKNLPAVQETWVRSLGWKDPLAKEMATHSSILAWKIPWTEEPGGLQSMGSQRVGYDWATNTSLYEIITTVVLVNIHHLTKV